MPNVSGFRVMVGKGVSGIEGGGPGGPEVMLSREAGSQIHWVPVEVGLDCEVKTPDGEPVKGLNEFFLMYHPGQGYERRGVEIGVFPGGTSVWRQGDVAQGENGKVYVDDPSFFKVESLFSDHPQSDQGMDGMWYYECGVVGKGKFMFMVQENGGEVVQIMLEID